MNSVCIHLKNVPMKVLCILLVGLQAFILDLLLITCHGDGILQERKCEPCEKCYWWIAGDVVVVAAFIVTFVVSYKHLEYHKSFKRLNRRHATSGLPLSCFTWFLYSAYVGARVIVIFKAGIDDVISEDDTFGPQFMKTGIALTAAVFMMFVASHHHPNEKVQDRLYINALATSVTFDVLDTVELLDTLIVTETGILIPFTMENGILAMAFINLIRPTFSFLVLICNHFGIGGLSRELSAANALIYIFLINIPYMVIRMLLWHVYNQSISVFLIKNFMMIFIGLHELWQISMERRREEGNPESIEMMPPRNLHPAHRPSDLRDGASGDEVPPDYNSEAARASQQL